VGHVEEQTDDLARVSGNSATLRGRPREKRCESFAAGQGWAEIVTRVQRNQDVWRIRLGQHSVGQDDHGRGNTHRYVDLLEHRNSLSCIYQSHILRRRDDHRAWSQRRDFKRVTIATWHSPSTATSWPRLSCTSPVPGGISITRTSRSSEPVSDSDVQSTSKRSCDGQRCKHAWLSG
jgi:hypothetical protein